MSNLNNNKPVNWDEVIERCYVKKEITAREAMKILNVSSSAFYRTVKNNPNYNEKTKSSYGGSRHRFEGEIRKLKDRIKELEDIIKNLRLKIKELESIPTEQLKLELEELKGKIKDKDNLLESKDEQYEELEIKLNELEQENNSLKSSKTRLEKSLEIQRELNIEILENPTIESTYNSDEENEIKKSNNIKKF